MSLRPYLDLLRDSNLLIEIEEKVKLENEITNYLQLNDGKAVLFHKIEDSEFPLLGNVLSSRDQIKNALSEQEGYYRAFQQALIQPSEPHDVETSLTFINRKQVNLNDLPIPRFFPSDGGRYLTSGIVFSQFPTTKETNMSIHRIMIISATKGAIRLVPRDLYNIFSENRQNGIDTPVAIAIGYHPILGLASSSPTPSGKSELFIANSLMKGTLSVVKTPKYGIKTPTDVEFILEGRILANEETEEGPFVDITGTSDDVRKQPIIEIEEIYHRNNPIFQTILPAHNEHFILMGFPREALIHNYISSIVPAVQGVYLTHGGCGWLHAVISITPHKDGDAKKVGQAAFEAHPSLKWCTIVNDDIDIYNYTAVEWATITRAGQNDITIIESAKGSSLDPSRNRRDNTSIKVIIDATKKEEKENKGYKRIIPF